MLTKHVHYVYDTLDHEIGKQVDDTGSGSYDRSEWYSLDVSPDVPQANVPSTSLADPLLEFDQNGNLAYRFLNVPTPAGVDAVIGEEQITTPGQAGTEYWPLFDQVNTPHEVVNNASTVVDHIIANTFGVVTSESNPSIHHWAGFGGGHNDPDTAMVNDDHRWYDPATGRWTSEDPEGFGAGDANLNRLAMNDPTGLTDPSGLVPPPSWQVQPLQPSPTFNGLPNPLYNYLFFGGFSSTLTLDPPYVTFQNGQWVYTWSNGFQYYSSNPLLFVVPEPWSTTVPVYSGPIPTQYQSVPSQTWLPTFWGGFQAIPGLDIDPSTGFGVGAQKNK